jgi:hypothetical protein
MMATITSELGGGDFSLRAGMPLLELHAVLQETYGARSFEIHLTERRPWRFRARPAGPLPGIEDVPDIPRRPWDDEDEDDE